VVSLGGSTRTNSQRPMSARSKADSPKATSPPCLPRRRRPRSSRRTSSIARPSRRCAAPPATWSTCGRRSAPSAPPWNWNAPRLPIRPACAATHPP